MKIASGQNKEKFKIEKANSRTKEGMRYVCDSCGIIVTVDKACSCNPCYIICCGQDMKILTRC